MINADYRQHMIPVDDAIAQLERFSDLARAELDRLPAELGPLDAETRLRLDAELVEPREKLDAIVLRHLRELRRVAGHG